MSKEINFSNITDLLQCLFPNLRKYILNEMIEFIVKDTVPKTDITNSTADTDLTNKSKNQKIKQIEKRLTYLRKSESITQKLCQLNECQSNQYQRPNTSAIESFRNTIDPKELEKRFKHDASREKANKWIDSKQCNKENIV